MTSALVARVSAAIIRLLAVSSEFCKAIIIG